MHEDTTAVTLAELDFKLEIDVELSVQAQIQSKSQVKKSANNNKGLKYAKCRQKKAQATRTENAFQWWLISGRQKYVI